MKHILLISLLFMAACKDFDIEHTITCDAFGGARWRLHILELPDADCYKDPDTCEPDIPMFIEVMEDAGGSDIEIINISTEPPYEYMITARYDNLEDIMILLAEDEPEMFIESITEGFRIQLWEEGPLTDPSRVAVIDKDFIPVKLVALGGEVTLKNGKSKRLVTVNTLSDLHDLELSWPVESKH